MVEREPVILHSDLNAFYASVETLLNPKLRGRAVAVCGSTEDRHGIVLAKSETAKSAGVKTGMVTWQAKQLCPELIAIPPSYGNYLKYSKLTKAIYARYTDRIEAFGMDECWLDVTGSAVRSGGGGEIADEIRRAVKSELGLTVSIGASFNKIFAKLGSDMKKPDAVTVITRDNYRDKVWPLPAGELLYVGRAAESKLAMYGIRTIGGIANTDPDTLRRLFGKNGLALWLYATGADTSRVTHESYEAPIKSIGHGTTCTSDLYTTEEVRRVMLYLAQDIGHRLRVHGLKAHGAQISVKDNELFYRQYQGQLGHHTQSPVDMSALAWELFERHYDWHKPVRAVTVRAINLARADTPEQLDFFGDYAARDRRRRIDDAVDDIRRRFGEWSIYPAMLMGEMKLPGTSLKDVIMPNVMYQ
jgi:DNA polymerase-4